MCMFFFLLLCLYCLLYVSNSTDVLLLYYSKHKLLSATVFFAHNIIHEHKLGKLYIALPACIIIKILGTVAHIIIVTNQCH